MSGDFDHNTRIDDLIIKFLDRQTTVEEEKDLQVWVSQSEENRRYLSEIQYLWNTVAMQDKIPFDSEAAFQRFKARIAVQKTVKNDSQHLNLYSLLRWIVIFLIAFLLGGSGFYILNNYFILKDKKQYSISVPVGAKVKIRLPDKSVVWLNSGSSLHYSQNFGIKSRKISLIGEAYFEVAKNPNKPFIVYTKVASIRVLGTKFDVNAYTDEDHIDVTLLKGSILLKTVYRPNVLTLKPNQRAIIDKKNQKVSVIHFAACKSVKWTKGESFLGNETIGETVHRSYNIKIVVKDYEQNKLHFNRDFST